MVADYEGSYQMNKAAQLDSVLSKKEAEEKSTKEALAKQLKDKEALQKQESKAPAKGEDERTRKELRANFLKS